LNIPSADDIVSLYCNVPGLARTVQGSGRVVQYRLFVDEHCAAGLHLALELLHIRIRLLPVGLAILGLLAVSCLLRLAVSCLLRLAVLRLLRSILGLLAVRRLLWLAVLRLRGKLGWLAVLWLRGVLGLLWLAVLRLSLGWKR